MTRLAVDYDELRAAAHLTNISKQFFIRLLTQKKYLIKRRTPFKSKDIYIIDRPQDVNTAAVQTGSITNTSSLVFDSSVPPIVSPGSVLMR